MKLRASSRLTILLSFPTSLNSTLFLSLKSQFANFEYYKKEFAFVRTEQQIDKIIQECTGLENSLILYTIVESKLAKYISNQSEKNNVPCFGILGNLILSFSKLLNQKAIHKPSAQHVLDEEDGLFG